MWQEVVVRAGKKERSRERKRNGKGKKKDQRGAEGKGKKKTKEKKGDDNVQQQIRTWASDEVEEE